MQLIADIIITLFLLLLLGTFSSLFLPRSWNKVEEIEEIEEVKTSTEKKDIAPW